AERLDLASRCHPGRAFHRVHARHRNNGALRKRGKGEKARPADEVLLSTGPRDLPGV
ncbi:MAG: hypothetical protein AVDCRST_MAG03-2906, partial [uncultured Rubrobacteraceae bacterium]